MPAFRAEVTHHLGQAEAVDRLRGFFTQMLTRFEDHISAVDGTWDDNVLGFSLTTSGMTVKGTLTVETETVRVDGQLPLLAMPFRGMIQESITAELAAALA